MIAGGSQKMFLMEAGISFLFSTVGAHDKIGHRRFYKKFMAFIGEDLQRLLYTLSKLPGLGTRSAKRLVLHLLKHKDTSFEALMESLRTVYETYAPCHICGYWDCQRPCFFCASSQRDEETLCIVEETSDVWVLEKAGVFKGRYHVLGGLFSSSAFSAAKCCIEPLMDRLRTGNHSIKEVIIALSSTMEAQTTLYYLMTELREHFPQFLVSRLSRGIPSGGELGYLDALTLSNAFLERKSVWEEGQSDDPGKDFVENIGGALKYREDIL